MAEKKGRYWAVNLVEKLVVLRVEKLDAWLAVEMVVNLVVLLVL